MMFLNKKLLAAAGAFVLCVANASSALAQAPRDRWSLEIGEAGAPGDMPDVVLYVNASARLATTGPLEWRAAAAVHGLTTIRRLARVSVGPYCPDTPNGVCFGSDGGSSLEKPVTAGLTLRVVRWPPWLSRTILEVGTGAYYGTWKDLPWYEPQRPAVFTGYRLATLGVRVTRHVGLIAGATQFRNVKHRDDETSGRIGVQVSW